MLQLSKINKSHLMSTPKVYFFEHEKTSLRFYEVIDPANDLHYVQQYDPQTDRGVGLRIAFWEEDGEQCSATGHAIEDQPGDYKTCQWHGDPVVKGTDKPLAPYIPPITQELRHVIYKNDISSVEAAMSEAKIASSEVVDITAATNPDAAKRFQDKALEEDGEPKFNTHISKGLSLTP